MNNIVIKVKGYSAKLQSTETLPTGQLDYTKVKFVIDESDTVWNDATLTATFSSLMPTGQRKTLPATVNADGEAIVPEKILSTKGAEFTAGLCGSWASGARIATNMVTVCKLLPGAAGDDLQDGLNNAIVNEEDVYNYIDEKSHIHDGEIDALGEAAENHENRIDTLEETMPTKANLVNGKVPSSELPSYVDDVVEYESIGDFPQPGESGKIYIAKDVGKAFRWSGSTYFLLTDTTELEADIAELQTELGGKADKVVDIVESFTTAASGTSKFTPAEIMAKDIQSLSFDGLPLLTKEIVSDGVRLLYLDIDSSDTERVRSLRVKTDKSFTTALAGNQFFSTEQRTKLAGIESGANKYILPAATASTLGGIKVGANLSIEEDGTLNASGGELTTDELVSVCVTDFIGINGDYLGTSENTILTI